MSKGNKLKKTLPFPIPRIDRRRALSLVEVTISLGIVAIALVPVIGLMGVGLNSARESVNDSRLSAMIRVVSDDLRARPFALLVAELQSAGTTSYYFDEEGMILPPSGAGAAIYRCTVVQVPLSPSDATLDGSLVRLRMDFSLPQQGESGLAVVPFAIAAYE